MTIPKFPHKTEYPVEFSFTSGGVNYFRFTDLNSMPSGRALPCIEFYIELSTKCDRDFLTAHYQANKKIMSNPKTINVTEMYKLNEQIGERLDLVFSSFHILRYASVVYFDDTENPETYDEPYNKKKIERWAMHNDIAAFFLTEPLTNLIPRLKTVGPLLPLYLKVSDKIVRLHLERLQKIISSDSSLSDLTQSLEFQMGILDKLQYLERVQ